MKKILDQSVILKSIGVYSPKRILTNNDLSNFVDTSDEWIFTQKGFNSIGFNERKEFLMSIKGVVDVLPVNDEDGTVCTALIEHKPTYFANGGPRNEKNTPEKIVCEELGIEMLWNVGSSWGNKC